jgi:hypothetical protein
VSASSRMAAVETKSPTVPVEGSSSPVAEMWLKEGKTLLEKCEVSLERRRANETAPPATPTVAKLQFGRMGAQAHVHREYWGTADPASGYVQSSQANESRPVALDAQPSMHGEKPNESLQKLINRQGSRTFTMRWATAIVSFDFSSCMKHACEMSGE